MDDKLFDRIIHGGDYNPDQWLNTPEIWDEDMRLMNLAHVNSATVGIFAWSLIEPQEGVYDFSCLDTIMDKLHENGKAVILATPSGARPPWLAEKYPEVLRVEENGIRNLFGVRHNHCLTSPVYREKVRNINRMLAEHYKEHPALKMWHISNEYSGECHCDLCQNAFRAWLKKEYNNDIDDLNERWWNGFWSHRLNSFEQISSPVNRGENHVSALKLAWKRFVTDSHISFYENEIAPLRELTPDIPITTNFMRMYDGIDYQKFAQHLDLISWDSYPAWEKGNNEEESISVAFTHDVFRSMKGGKPFFLMESTPSLVNWHPVNKLPKPERQALSSMQAVAHGADSIQYFQWRKSRGGHEKYHGAVVDHCGHENTRVFREVTRLGKQLERLADITGSRTDSRVAVVCDWENIWAVRYFCGYNNNRRDYIKECEKWYAPFCKRGIATDVIAMDADFSKYDLVIAPFLYMLKDGTAERIEEYVKNGGTFLMTYLSALVDTDDRCYLGGFPAGNLKNVFGIVCEETDSLPENMTGKASFNGKMYDVNHVCDILHADTAAVLGTYESDFYAGTPAVTKNTFGKGAAWYAAFRNDDCLADDICQQLIVETGLVSDAAFPVPDGVQVRKRGDFLFVLNFADDNRSICLDKEYTDVLAECPCSGTVTLPECGYLILK